MEIIILVVLLVTLVLVIIIAIINKVYNSKVLNHSEKNKLVNQMNKNFLFNDVVSDYEVKKHYDNKGNYNKIEPAYVMSSYIRNNIVEFSIIIDKVKENRLLFEKYKNEIMHIVSKPTNMNYKEIKVPKNIFLMKEKKLIKKTVLKPTIDINLYVYMSYSSAKGQVNISKNDTFNFDDIFTSFESISRTYLDKETYEKLMLVERGEVSDSLRYDIMKGDNFRCTICGASANEGVRLHIDHIIPVSKGGKSNIENLRTLCERCNVGKSDKIES